MSHRSLLESLARGKVISETSSLQFPKKKSYTRRTRILLAPAFETAIPFNYSGNADLVTVFK
jgi:hypothetical protein